MSFRNILVTALIIAFGTTAWSQGTGSKKKVVKKAAAAAQSAPKAAAPPATPPPAPEVSKEEAAAPAPKPVPEAPKTKIETEGKPVRTVFFLQAPGGKSAVTGRLSYSTFKTDVKNAAGAKTYDFTLTGMNFSLEYEHGFTDQHSAALMIGYDSKKLEYAPASGATTTTFTMAGLQDVSLIVRGQRFYEDIWTANYGATLNVNTGNKTLKNNNGTTALNITEYSGNGTSGGLSFEPYIGMQHKLSPGNILGARLRYTYLFDRKMDTDTSGVTFGTNSSSTTSGGHTTNFMAFYEHQMDTSACDIAVGYQSTSDSTKTVSGTNTAYTGAAGFVVAAGFAQFVSRNSMIGLEYRGISLGSSEDIIFGGNNSQSDSARWAHQALLGGRYMF